MNISRRNVLLGATAAAALGPIAARAQTSEVVIGVIYPFSGASAQMGVDAQKSYETALDIINKDHDFDLPLAKGEGSSGVRRPPGRSAEGPRRDRTPHHPG
jgi:branched-chain amino acid transport system substrate-binding protein